MSIPEPSNYNNLSNMQNNNRYATSRTYEIIPQHDVCINDKHTPTIATKIWRDGPRIEAKKNRLTVHKAKKMLDDELLINNFEWYNGQEIRFWWKLDSLSSSQEEIGEIRRTWNEGGQCYFQGYYRLATTNDIAKNIRSCRSPSCSKNKSKTSKFFHDNGKAQGPAIIAVKPKNNNGGSLASVPPRLVVENPDVHNSTGNTDVHTHKNNGNNDYYEEVQVSTNIASGQHQPAEQMMMIKEQAPSYPQVVFNSDYNLSGPPRTNSLALSDFSFDDGLDFVNPFENEDVLYKELHRHDGEKSDKASMTSSETSEEFSPQNYAEGLKYHPAFGKIPKHDESELKAVKTSLEYNDDNARHAGAS